MRPATHLPSGSSYLLKCQLCFHYHKCERDGAESDVLSDAVSSCSKCCQRIAALRSSRLCRQYDTGQIAPCWSSSRSNIGFRVLEARLLRGIRSKSIIL